MFIFVATQLTAMIHIDSSARGLIFDLDGTLADTMGMHVEAWIGAGREFGITITRAMINDNAGIPTQPLLALLNKQNGWSVNPSKFEEVKDQHYNVVKEAHGQIQPIPDVMSIVDTYKDLLPMAVGTGSTRADALLAIDELGISSLIKGLVTADDVTHPKPHPETFLTCATIIGVAPQYCQVFEDSLKGVEAALAGGMMVTNILTGELSKP